MSRREIGERIALECPKECISTCGAVEYAMEAAKVIEQRAVEDAYLSQPGEVPVEVACSGKRPRFYLFGKMVCPQKMKVTLQADPPYDQAVDFRYFNSWRNQPESEI